MVCAKSSKCPSLTGGVHCSSFMMVGSRCEVYIRSSHLGPWVGSYGPRWQRDLKQGMWVPHNDGVYLLAMDCLLMRKRNKFQPSLDHPYFGVPVNPKCYKDLKHIIALYSWKYRKGVQVILNLPWWTNRCIIRTWTRESVSQISSIHNTSKVSVSCFFPFLF